MTDHPYFQPAAAGWEQALELEYEQEQILKPKHRYLNMSNSNNTGGADRHKPSFHASNVGNSRFFTREDVLSGLTGTISGMTYENVAPPDKPEDLKWCANFREHTKMLTLNKARKNQIIHIAGGPTEEDWIGTNIEMFDDPSVEFGGKRVGGIRVRAPEKAKTGGDKPPADADFDDDERLFFAANKKVYTEY